MACIECGVATLKAYPNFNAEEDARVLRKAMKGVGTDEASIIEVLGNRTQKQRNDIAVAFKTLFGLDLLSELKSELSGNFERAVLRSLKPLAAADAEDLKAAMKGTGTREDTLTEILCTRSNTEIEKIKKEYALLCPKSDPRTALEKDVMSETSGFYRRVLVSLLQANKKELPPEKINMYKSNGLDAVVDRALAKKEAQDLYNAGEKKLGTDEAMFLQVFLSRDPFQLRATFEEYENISKKSIIKAIESETSGDLKSALKALVLCAMGHSQYFAHVLNNAMAGLGTKDATLMRVLETRSEIDMENIKDDYQRNYKRPLRDDVCGDTSGDYKKFLLKFVGS